MATSIKVTCGACGRGLRVEPWLADNVARCPKCNEIIHIPPAGSDGVTATAAPMTAAQAAEMLRRRASETPGSHADGEQVGAGGRSRSPKTEPLTAMLSRVAPGVHEEPEQQKTKPLPRMPRPAAEPSSTPARTAAAESSPEPGGEPAGRGSGVLIAAFIGGLIVGGICGWVLARAMNQPAEIVTQAPEPGNQPPDSPNSANDQPEPQPRQERVKSDDSQAVPRPVADAPVRTPIQAAPSVENTIPAEAAPAASQTAETPRPQPIKWLDGAMPSSPLRLSSMKWTQRLMAVPNEVKADNCYWPAPPRQIYIEATATLSAAEAPVTLRLGGPDSDAVLVARNSGVFRSLGTMPKDAAAGGWPFDEKATVLLDGSDKEVTVVFLAPEGLTEFQVQFLGQIATAREGQNDGVARSPEGRWQVATLQTPVSASPARQAITRMILDGRGAANIDKHSSGAEDKQLAVSINGHQVKGKLAPTADGRYYDFELTASQGAINRGTARVSPDGKQLIFYLPDRPVVFQRRMSFFN